ncbi:MAG: hypothetical protein ACE5GK_07480 [Nitrospiria bacterium]
MRRLGIWVLYGYIAMVPVMAYAQALDRSLLEKTLQAAKANVVPSQDVEVVYDVETKHVHISFTTPPDYRVSSDGDYRRWRSNQWSVLQEFMLSRIPVESVTVETNDINNDRLIRYRHRAAHVDKYGDIRENRLWLRTARGTQKRKGSDTWEKIE